VRLPPQQRNHTAAATGPGHFPVVDTEPQEAEKLTQRADDIITLVDELSAPDDLNTTPH
jgi:hypothetical protein